MRVARAAVRTNLACGRNPLRDRGLKYGRVRHQVLANGSPVPVADDLACRQGASSGTSEQGHSQNRKSSNDRSGVEPVEGSCGGEQYRQQNSRRAQAECPAGRSFLGFRKSQEDVADSKRNDEADQPEDCVVCVHVRPPRFRSITFPRQFQCDVDWHPCASTCMQRQWMKPPTRLRYSVVSEDFLSAGIGGAWMAANPVPLAAKGAWLHDAGGSSWRSTTAGRRHLCRGGRKRFRRHHACGAIRCDRHMRTRKNRAGARFQGCCGNWNWWSGWGSNPRPSHCERDALPAELPPHARPGDERPGKAA
jgi:hypothetical protein